MIRSSLHTLGMDPKIVNSERSGVESGSSERSSDVRITPARVILKSSGFGEYGFSSNLSTSGTLAVSVGSGDGCVMHEFNSNVKHKTKYQP